MMPRVVTSALAVAAAFGFVAMPSESAPGSFANQPFQTWDTDGAVSSIVATPSAVYVGGNFTQIGRRTGSSAALSPAGQVQPGWPESDGTVEAVVSDGSGGWFIGGTFKRVGGLARSGLAHITRRKNVDARWAPAISPARTSSVDVLVRRGSTLYAGGGFTKVDGTTRRGLAALDTSTGHVLAWNPALDEYSSVDALALGPDGRTLFFAGFLTRSRARRDGLAAVDAKTGLATPWNPNPHGIPNFVYALCTSRDGRTVFVGGAFHSIGGKRRAPRSHKSTRARERRLHGTRAPTTRAIPAPTSTT